MRCRITISKISGRDVGIRTHLPGQEIMLVETSSQALAEIATAHGGAYEIEIPMEAGDTAIPEVTADGRLEWWVFDRDGELVEVYWLESDERPKPAKGLGKWIIAGMFMGMIG